MGEHLNSIYSYLAIPLLPLIASFSVGILGRRLPEFFASSMTILSVFIAFVLSCTTLHETLNGLVLNQTIYQWLLSGHYQFEVGFLIDNLTAMMMVVVTFVSLMVHIYTMGYMKGDPGYRRFFSYISLFTFSMLMLVMSNNFMQLFFGWEAVGLVSYLLIGFWFERPTAIYANLKAFLVNRVGDFGFILGIALILYWTGSLDYVTVFKSAGIIAAHKMQLFGQPIADITVICILLFIGAMGKSAQVPLHVWLPDSMEGPTPISALIHAATMVTAGIFMVSRTSPLFELLDLGVLGRHAQHVRVEVAKRGREHESGAIEIDHALHRLLDGDRLRHLFFLDHLHAGHALQDGGRFGMRLVVAVVVARSDINEADHQGLLRVGRARQTQCRRSGHAAQQAAPGRAVADQQAQLADAPGRLRPARRPS